MKMLRHLPVKRWKKGDTFTIVYAWKGHGRTSRLFVNGKEVRGRKRRRWEKWLGIVHPPVSADAHSAKWLI